MLDGVLMNASLARLLRLAIQWPLSAVLTVKRLTNSPWCSQACRANDTGGSPWPHALESSLRGELELERKIDRWTD